MRSGPRLPVPSNPWQLAFVADYVLSKRTDLYLTTAYARNAGLALDQAAVDLNATGYGLAAGTPRAERGLARRDILSRRIGVLGPALLGVVRRHASLRRERAPERQRQYTPDRSCSYACHGRRQEGGLYRSGTR